MGLFANIGINYLALVLLYTLIYRYYAANYDFFQNNLSRSELMIFLICSFIENRDPKNSCHLAIILLDIYIYFLFAR